MIIKGNEANQKEVGPMIIREYKINPKYSGALIDIDGTHGKLKCTEEDRIYFIIDGQGKFVINNEENNVQKHDLIFIPKNTEYDIIGKMKYFLICSPEFDPKHDIFLK